MTGEKIHLENNSVKLNYIQSVFSVVGGLAVVAAQSCSFEQVNVPTAALKTESNIS